MYIPVRRSYAADGALPEQEGIMKIGNDEYLKKSLDVFRIVARHTCDDPITAAKIEELTSVDTRMIASMLREFEQAGFMVISTGTGYGIARNAEEWNNHLNKEYDRGVNILRKVSQSKKRRENAPSLFDRPLKMITQTAQTPA